MKKTIVVCASVSHYRQIVPVEKELKALGFRVLMPDTLRIMKRNNNFDANAQKTWLKNKNDYSKKAQLIRAHFAKILESNAILVLNYEKNGIQGYIGGNVLIEMAIAFHYKKPIFVLNQTSEELKYVEEIYGMKPKFLSGDLKKIRI